MSKTRKPASLPFILGLTGSIGMGKSTTAELFRAFDVPVHDSDAVVHELYASGGKAAIAIADVFPGAIRADGSIDRSILRAMVLDDSESLATLEAIVHSLVRERETLFLAHCRFAPLVILDIPLLFETGAEKRCHAVLVVTAPQDVQRSRVLSRPDMTEMAFDAILRRQRPDAEKRACADHVIDTSLGLPAAKAAVVALLTELRG